MLFRKTAQTVNPAQTTRFSGQKWGFLEPLLTRDFLYSTMVFVSDAPLAQLDRALDFGSSGRGFESLRARQQIRSGYPFSGARIFIPRQKPDRLTPESNLKILVQPRGWSSGTTSRCDIRARTPKRKVSVSSEAVQPTNPLWRTS